MTFHSRYPESGLTDVEKQSHFQTIYENLGKYINLDDPQHDGFRNQMNEQAGGILNVREDGAIKNIDTQETGHSVEGREGIETEIIDQEIIQNIEKKIEQLYPGSGSFSDTNNYEYSFIKNFISVFENDCLGVSNPVKKKFLSLIDSVLSDHGHIEENIAEIESQWQTEISKVVLQKKVYRSIQNLKLIIFNDRESGLCSEEKYNDFLEKIQSYEDFLQAETHLSESDFDNVIHSMKILWLDWKEDSGETLAGPLDLENIPTQEEMQQMESFLGNYEGSHDFHEKSENKEYQKALLEIQDSGIAITPEVIDWFSLEKMGRTDFRNSLRKLISLGLIEQYNITDFSLEKGTSTDYVNNIIALYESGIKFEDLGKEETLISSSSLSFERVTSSEYISALFVIGAIPNINDLSLFDGFSPETAKNEDYMENLKRFKDSGGDPGVLLGESTEYMTNDEFIDIAIAVNEMGEDALGNWFAIDRDVVPLEYITNETFVRNYMRLLQKGVDISHRDLPGNAPHLLNESHMLLIEELVTRIGSVDLQELNSFNVYQNLLSNPKLKENVFSFLESSNFKWDGTFFKNIDRIDFSDKESLQRYLILQKYDFSYDDFRKCDFTDKGIDSIVSLFESGIMGYRWDVGFILGNFGKIKPFLENDDCMKKFEEFRNRDIGFPLTDFFSLSVEYFLNDTVTENYILLRQNDIDFDAEIEKLKSETFVQNVLTLISEDTHPADQSEMFRSLSLEIGSNQAIFDDFCEQYRQMEEDDPTPTPGYAKKRIEYYSDLRLTSPDERSTRHYEKLGEIFSDPQKKEYYDTFREILPKMDYNDLIFLNYNASDDLQRESYLFFRESGLGSDFLWKNREHLQSPEYVQKNKDFLAEGYSELLFLSPEKLANESYMNVLKDIVEQNRSVGNDISYQDINIGDETFYARLYEEKRNIPFKRLSPLIQSVKSLTPEKQDEFFSVVKNLDQSQEFHSLVSFLSANDGVVPINWEAFASPSFCHVILAFQQNTKGQENRTFRAIKNTVLPNINLEAVDSDDYQKTILMLREYDVLSKRNVFRYIPSDICDQNYREDLALYLNEDIDLSDNFLKTMNIAFRYGKPEVFKRNIKKIRLSGLELGNIDSLLHTCYSDFEGNKIDRILESVIQLHEHNIFINDAMISEIELTDLENTAYIEALIDLHESGIYMNNPADFQSLPPERITNDSYRENLKILKAGSFSFEDHSFCEYLDLEKGSNTTYIENLNRLRSSGLTIKKEDIHFFTLEKGTSEKYVQNMITLLDEGIDIEMLYIPYEHGVSETYVQKVVQITNEGVRDGYAFSESDMDAFFRQSESLSVLEKLESVVNQKTEHLKQKFLLNGIQFYYVVDGLNAHYKNAQQPELKLAYLEELDQELSKYPPVLFQYLSKEKPLSFEISIRKGWSDARLLGAFSSSENVVKIVKDSSITALRERATMHHEILHALDHKDGLTDDLGFWNQNLSKESTDYADLNETDAFDTPEEDLRFITPYSSKNAEEDQAEIIQALFHNEIDLFEKAKQFPDMQKKIELLTGCYFDPEKGERGQFVKTYTPEEYKAEFGSEGYEYFAKWDEKNEDGTPKNMNHEYWNKVWYGKKIDFYKDQ